MEKILILLESEDFNDVYIGLSLFDKLSYGEQLKFLRQNFKKGNNTNYTWHFSRVNKNSKNYIPQEYEGSYIEGQRYSYVVQEDSIMIDSPTMTKRWTSLKEDPWPIIESWKK